MTMKMNLSAYVELVLGDLAWLRKQQPDTLERKHIEAIVRASVRFEYPDACDVPTDEIDWSPEANAYNLGRSNCVQDGMENAPFASVGGLDSRQDPQPPYWMKGAEDPRWPKYRTGYEDQARLSYGEDWKTCSFTWSPAVVIGP